MYEHHSQPLLPRRQFITRFVKHSLSAAILLFAGLGIGVLGYRYLEGLTWLDALLNASMILGGMGPVNSIESIAGKWFASFYALFSGIVFLAGAGIVMAPVAHRILHRLHLQNTD